MNFQRIILIFSMVTMLICVSCAGSGDTSPQNPDKKDNESEETEGYGAGMGAGDPEYERKMFKESVVKIQDVPILEKFAIIKNVDKFKESCSSIETPKHAILHLFNALHVYLNAEKEVGIAFLREIIAPNYFLTDNKLHPMLESLFDQAKKDPRILNSYLGGVKPDFVLTNPNEITVSFFMGKNYQIVQNKWKLFVKSTGKEAHSSIVVEEQNGRFRVSEFNEIFTKLNTETD